MKLKFASIIGIIICQFFFSQSLDHFHNEASNQKILFADDSINSLIDKVIDRSLIITKRIMPRMSRLNLKPQSLSILMNFGHDGTSSLHLMSDINSIYWSDIGHCGHGQMYDPLHGCRDIFCVEGYIFGPDGCTFDTSHNKQNSSNVKISPEIKVELTILNELCTVVERFNTTESCFKFSISDKEDLLTEFKTALASFLEINPNRVQNLINISTDYVKKEISQKIRDLRNLSDSSNENFENEEFVAKAYRFIENIRVNFVFKDKKLFDGEERDSIQLYFTLIALGLIQHPIHIVNRAITLSNIIEIKDSDYIGWCEESDDTKEYIINDFRILVKFDSETEKQYFVYVNKTNSFYSTGYYYLTIIYQKSDSFYKSNFIDVPDLNPSLQEFPFQPSDTINRPIDYSKINFTDITDYILRTNESDFQTSSILVVCNRRAKIRVTCNKYTKIRVRICEFKFIESSRSYCWSRSNNEKCYSINEYEYDNQEPGKYILICQYIANDVNLKETKSDSNRSSLLIAIPAWLSLMANSISLVLMILSLITYALFSELRNIPGWNIINLIIALCIAQSAFLTGSYVNEFSLVCFVIALITHYGYLSSFFWMNVIAFDLYRNFRKKSSLVLIQSLKLKDRLPSYLIYGWLSPLIIVLVGLSIDLIITKPYYEVPFRPCYAGYLEGCDVIKDVYNFNKGSSNTKTDVSITTDLTVNSTTNECESLKEPNIIQYLLLKSCWIQNGRANLIFFGVPIGIIILINAVFYFISIYNIRKIKRKQKENNLRRFSRVKLPSDEEVKFYIQMAIIMGFTWCTGFLMTTTENLHYVLSNIILYTFILANGFSGSFIFFAFICKPEVKMLYLKLFKRKSKKSSTSIKSQASKKSQKLNSTSKTSSQNSLSFITTSSTTISNSNDQKKITIKDDSIQVNQSDISQKENQSRYSAGYCVSVSESIDDVFYTK